jgi:hypothetical protein
MHHVMGVMSSVEMLGNVERKVGDMGRACEGSEHEMLREENYSLWW